MTMRFSMSRILLLSIALLALYLLFWPVSIEPLAWNAPKNRGLVGLFAPNDRLAAAQIIDIAPYEGPEDIAGGPDWLIYASTVSGDIIRSQLGGPPPEPFVYVGGREGFDIQVAKSRMVY